MATTLRLMEMLKRLNEHGVQFVVVGGVAAIVHGATRATFDLDVCASLSVPNIARLLDALRDLRPRHRMHPSKPILADDPGAFTNFKYLYVETDLGVLDILTTVEGVGSFDEANRRSVSLDVQGSTVRVLTLDALIAAKLAANRPKDRQAVAELKLLLAKMPAEKNDAI